MAIRHFQPVGRPRRARSCASRCGLAVLASIWMVGQMAVQASAAPPAADGALAERVWSVLNAKCLSCHGNDEKKIKAKLDLRTRAGALKGGESGPAVVPGNAEESLLYIGVTRAEEDFAMPPKESDKLSAEQVELIRNWIAAGAAWPDAVAATPVVARKPQPATQPKNADDWSPSADGVGVATSGGLSKEWDERKYAPQDLWAYQPVKRHPPPTDLIDADSVKNPIDAFIQQKLKQNGVAGLAAPADKL